MKFEVRLDPTPHIFLEQLIDPAVYAQIDFPELSRREQGRIGRDLYQGEPGFEEKIAAPGWREIYAKFTGEEFRTSVLGAMSDQMEKHGCTVKAAECYFEPFIENREQTESCVLSRTHPAESVFHRFDFQAGDAGYRKGIHRDHDRRIVGGVLFFCDQDEIGLEGGSFGLYRDRRIQNGGEPEAVREYCPRHNTGVLFLNCGTGYHGPTPIRAVNGLRQWVYYSISSRRNVWPAKSRKPIRRSWRRSLSRFAKKLLRKDSA